MRAAVAGKQVRELHERGLSMRAIARKLDLNFKTVRRYLRTDNVETLLAGGVSARSCMNGSPTAS